MKGRKTLQLRAVTFASELCESGPMKRLVTVQDGKSLRICPEPLIDRDLRRDRIVIGGAR